MCFPSFLLFLIIPTIIPDSLSNLYLLVTHCIAESIVGVEESRMVEVFSFKEYISQGEKEKKNKSYHLGLW